MTIDSDWATWTSSLLRIIHDTTEIPQLRHIREEAMVRLSKMNEDLAKAKSPPTPTYDPVNDPLKQPEVKPKAFPSATAVDSVKRI